MPEYYYVPLDFSEAQSYVPKEDKIIYSTLCEFKRVGGGTIGVISFVAGQIADAVSKYETHLLITDHGFVFGQKKQGYTYLPWCTKDLSPFVYKDSILLGNDAVLKVIRDPAYETKEQFKERMKLWQPIVTPLKIDYTTRFLGSPEGALLEPRTRKEIWSNMSVMEMLLDKAVAKLDKKSQEELGGWGNDSGLDFKQP